MEVGRFGGDVNLYIRWWACSAAPVRGKGRARLQSSSVNPSALLGLLTRTAGVMRGGRYAREPTPRRP